MNKKQRVEGTEGRSGRIEGNTILVGDAEIRGQSKYSMKHQGPRCAFN